LAGAFAVAGLFAVVTVLALRVALAYLPDNARRIQAWIERQTDFKLEFASLDARLRWWGPEAVLRDVRVLDGESGEALFQTREATVSIDVWNLFRTGELVAGRLRFVGPAVTLVRLPDGRIRLLGLRERPAERPVFDLERLPAGRVEIAEASVRFEDRLEGRGPWVLSDVQLSLRRARHAAEVTGSARLPPELGKRIEFDGRLRGSLDRLSDLDARLELRIERIALAGLTDFLPAHTGRPTNGGGSASIVVAAGQGRIQQLRLDLDLEDVAFELPERAVPAIETVQVSPPRRAEDASPLSLPVGEIALVKRPAPVGPHEARYAVIAGSIRLRREGETWNFRADGLRLRAASGESDRTLTVAGHWSGHPVSAFVLQLNVARLRLDDVWPLVLVGAPPAFDRWAGLDPSGEVRDLSVDVLRERAGSEPRFTVSADVAGLSVRPVGRWPGLAGLTAQLSGTDQRGRIALDAVEPSFDLPRLFREPIVLGRASAMIDWWRDGAVWVLSTRGATLARESATAQGDAEIRLGRGRNYPQLVADARVEGFDVTAVRGFVPVGRLKPATVAWLEQAFVAGRVSQGRLSYRGPVRRFPFPRGEGEFVATADASGVTLNYFDGFAPLTDAAGSVEFRNASTRASLREGRVGGLRLERGEFGLADYREPVLEVRTAGSGDVGQALRFLQESPLGAQLGDQFMELSGQGPSEFAFDLRLPTARPEEHAFKVRTRLRAATLRWPLLRLPVTRLTGELEITERAARGEALRGSYLDGPFEISVQPGPLVPGVAMSLRLAAEGRAAGAQIPVLIGLPEGIRMSGDGSWRLQGRIDRPSERGAPWPTLIEIESDLTGLQIDAPRPFAKRPDESRPTRIALGVPRPGRTDLRIESGQARAVLEFARRDDGRWLLERGAARLDGRPVEPSSRPGLQVAGSWPEFDLGEWLALRSSAPGGPRLTDWLGPVDVHLDRAKVIGFEFLDVNARMQPLDGVWRIRVSGPMAEGVVTIPEDLSTGQPIELQMQRLQLETPPGRAEGSAGPESDPRDLPALLVQADDLTWQGRHFGRLVADVRKDPRGLRLENLSTESGEFTLRGSGTWYAEEAGPWTRLGLEFTSDDLAAASRALGYRDAVDAERASIVAQVSWSGGPDQDAIARMDGTLQLKLDRGQLRGVNPGAGRMLGLLSVIELPRRLALDFRDVTDEGLAFDTVRGTFEVRSGNAHTHDLLLQGAAVDIGVVGRTGLAAQDYDQTIVVSGNPSGPLTLAGALAGGPVGAAGALLLSQLFKGQLQGLARVYYRVTGPWSDPVVTRISASVGTGLPTTNPPEGVPP